jgi:nucleotide-binding universal stress UspA family protein
MKHKFKIDQILVPIDFSESSHNTINHAISIANKSNASIHLLHVVSISSHIFPNLNEKSDTTSLLKGRITHELNNLVDELKSTNETINFSAEIIEGSASTGIPEVASKKKVDLVVMGTHGISGVQEFFMGSNAFRVVTAAKCPVLTINNNYSNSDYKKIALPIDSSLHSRDKVSEVTAFAKLYDSKVLIAGLITGEHEDEKKIFNAKIKQVEEHLTVNGIDFELSIIHGNDIAEMTRSFAQTVGADLIAIMTEQEASTGLFVGPHAQRIVNQSRIPVLSVTPLSTLDLTSQGNLRPFHS